MRLSLRTSQFIDLLRILPLFNEVADNDLAPLAAVCRVDHFDEGSVLFYAGDACTRVWIVYKGQVKIIRCDENGREYIPEIIPPGEAFGGATIFFTSQPATAQALTPVETVSLQANHYADFLRNHPQIAVNFIKMLGSRLQTIMTMNTLTGERVERRIAHILLKLASRTGRPDSEGTLIGIPLSRQDIADMAGTTLETTIRVMSRFRTEGFVKTLRGGYIVIHKLEALDQLART